MLSLAWTPQSLTGYKVGSEKRAFSPQPFNLAKSENLRFGLQRDILAIEPYQADLLERLGQAISPADAAYIQRLDETGQTPEEIRDALKNAGFNLLSVKTPSLPEPRHLESMRGEFAYLPDDVSRNMIDTLEGTARRPADPLSPGQKQSFVTNQTLAAIEMAKKSVGMATAVGVSNGLALEAINQIATDEQKKIWLPPLQTGALSYAFGLTESAYGSDPRSMHTRFIPFQEGGKTFYQLHGDKKFIGNAAAVMDGDKLTHRGADFIIVFAVDDYRKSPNERIYHAFMVPRTLIAQGKIQSTGPKLGLREVNNGDFTLNDIKVPEAFLLGRPEENIYQKLMDTLNISRIFVAAMAVGSAEASIQKAADYATNSRTQYGHPIKDFQAVSFRIRQQQAKTVAARLLTLDAARMADAEMKQHEPKTRRFEMNASMAKLFASETALENAYTLIRTLGGRGYLEDTKQGLGAPKMFRDAAVLPIYEGTSDIQRLMISRSIIRTEGLRLKKSKSAQARVKAMDSLARSPFYSPRTVDGVYQVMLANIMVSLDKGRQRLNSAKIDESAELSLSMPLQRRTHLLADVATYRQALVLAGEQLDYWEKHPPKTKEEEKQQKLLEQFKLDATEAVLALYGTYRSGSLKNLEKLDKDKVPL